MNAKSKMPAIRFEGFSGEWVKEKIINIAPLQRGFDLPKSKIQIGRYPVVMSNGVNCYHSYFKAKAPGVVTGRSGTIGNIHYIENDYWPHNTTLWVTNFKGNSPIFIYYMYTKLDLNRFGTGSGVPTLNRNDVHDQSINVPEITKEQTKIGNYFQQLDTLIAQHQKKHDKLLNLKKALLEKLFPKQGATEPEIRFKGFSGEWEARKLETIFNKIRNAFVGTATPYYVKSGHFYLESNNVKNGKINRNTEVFINDEFYQKQSDKWLRTGDIVMVQSGHVGHTAVIPPELNNISAHALIMFTEPKEEINPHCFNYQFQTIKSKNQLTEITTGNTIKHILSSEMKDFYISFPRFNEQTKIGNLFKQLDTLITQHQTQLKKLNNIKQACLEKMFV